MAKPDRIPAGFEPCDGANVSYCTRALCMYNAVVHDGRHTALCSGHLAELEQMLLSVSPCTEQSHDAVKPGHYASADGKFECIDIIEAYRLNYRLGNVLKYVLRHGKKPGDDGKQDLRKALAYLYREVHGRWPSKEDK